MPSSPFRIKTFDRMVEGQQRPHRLSHPRVRGHERCLRQPLKLWAAARCSASRITAFSAPKDHPRPLHPCEHPPRLRSSRETDTMVGQQPRIQHGATPWASARCWPLYKKNGILPGHGHRCLYQRHARIPSRLPLLLPALQCLHAQRGLGARLPICSLKNNAKIGARYFPDELGRPSRRAPPPTSSSWDYKPFTPFSDANIDGPHDLRHDRPPVPDQPSATAKS